jgi:hypothetical protein
MLDEFETVLGLPHAANTETDEEPGCLAFADDVGSAVDSAIGEITKGLQ